MGTTGTIMGCSRFFKEKNPKIEIIGCQPQEGSQIPGIRKWPEAYLPKIYDKARVDRLEYVGQGEAEEMTRRLAREEGIFAGISSGGAMHVTLRIAKELKNAVIVTIVCTGVTGTQHRGVPIDADPRVRHRDGPDAAGIRAAASEDLLTRRRRARVPEAPRQTKTTSCRRTAARS
jgi:hypothetical protein